MTDEEKIALVNILKHEWPDVPLDLTAFIANLPGKAGVELMERVHKYGAECARQGVRRIADMLTEEAKHSAYAAQLLSTIRREISGEPK